MKIGADTAASQDICRDGLADAVQLTMAGIAGVQAEAMDIGCVVYLTTFSMSTTSVLDASSLILYNAAVAEFTGVNAAMVSSSLAQAVGRRQLLQNLPTVLITTSVSTSSVESSQLVSDVVYDGFFDRSFQAGIEKAGLTAYALNMETSPFTATEFKLAIPWDRFEAQAKRSVLLGAASPFLDLDFLMSLQDVDSQERTDRVIERMQQAQLSMEVDPTWHRRIVITRMTSHYLTLSEFSLFWVLKL